MKASAEQRDFTTIARIGGLSVPYRHALGIEVSEAHGKSHLAHVAEGTYIVSDLYEYTPRERFLAYTTGWLHALSRHPTEDPLVSDNQASANQARRLLHGLNTRKQLLTTKEEQDAISYAIAAQMTIPYFLEIEKTRERLPTTLKEKLHFALFVADKIEENGPWVIARRSSFVAGERLHAPAGDLQEQFRLEDGLTVVALENILRLTFLNPQYIYPERLQPIVDPLFTLQREFASAICKASGYSIEDIADLLLDKNNPDGTNMLERRQIVAPRSIWELCLFIEGISGVTHATIADTDTDTALSAMVAVLYFSQHYQENLEKMVEGWDVESWIRPLAPAIRWKKGMLDYMNGTWLNTVREQLK